MCTVLEISRSGYYEWTTRQDNHRAKEDAELLMNMKQIHEDHRKVCGVFRMKKKLVALLRKNRQHASYTPSYAWS